MAFDEASSQSYPFDEELEICTKLRFCELNSSLTRSKENNNSTMIKNYLPGNPRIRLGVGGIELLLCSEFLTPRLDKLAPHFWLLAKPDSRHISSLTHQQVKGRRFVVTEDPEMHLVWYEDRVFLKPLPKFLLSFSFWSFLLQEASEHGPLPNETFRPRQQLAMAALGYIRSYALLIRHKSDFKLAKNCSPPLLPKKVGFSELVHLLQVVDARVSDAHVSARWTYGELRLSRLNLWSKIFLQQIEFAKVNGQYSTYVAKFYAPLLFIFGVLTVVLSALQVGLGTTDGGEDFTNYMTTLAKGFVVFSLLVVLLLTAVVCIAVGTRMVREVEFAVRQKLKRRKDFG